MREYVELLFNDPQGGQLGFSRSVGEQYWRSSGDNALNTSAVWTAANLAVYAPIIIEQHGRITGFAIHNGAALSGNLSLGLYAPDSEGKPGTRLASVESAHVNTNQWQISSPTAFYIAPGLYYLAAAFDNGVAQVRRLVALAADGRGPWMGSIFTQAAAYPLPASATPSAAHVAAAVPEMALVR